MKRKRKAKTDNGGVAIVEESSIRSETTTTTTTTATTPASVVSPNDIPSPLLIQRRLLLCNHDVLATIMSFCNVMELFALGRTCSVFRRIARLVVSRADVLHFSVVAAASAGSLCVTGHAVQSKHTRSIQSVADSADAATPSAAAVMDKFVARMLQDASSSGRCRLQRLDVSGLRSAHGQEWLHKVLVCSSSSSLMSLDLSGCSHLNPRVLEHAVQCSARAAGGKNHCSVMKHVDLTGCRRVDERAVMAILETWRHSLETLELGGCSQTIGTGACLAAIARTVPNLCSLDYSGFVHVANVHGDLCALPVSLESLFLSGCERIQDLSLLQVASKVLPTLRQHLLEGNLRRLAEYVKAGDMDETWSLLFLGLSDRSRDELSRICDTMNVYHFGWPNLRALDVSYCRNLLVSALSSVGSPTCLGFLSCLSGGSLREINITGCDHVTDEDIQMLAVTCHNSLTCLEARACRLGDNALFALGKECRNLAVLDVSACFDVTDEGVVALCPRDDLDARGCRALRSLKLASLPNLTDRAIRAIEGGEEATCGLRTLLLLDVRDCANVSSRALDRVLAKLPLLVELDARGTSGKVSRATLSNSALRFLNGRSLGRGEQAPCTSFRRSCSAMQHSQRLKASHGITMQPMYHCADCKLLPSESRGMCGVCASVCHKGHATFFGSMTRFYCDCAFGIVAGEGCKALVNPNQGTQHTPSCIESP